MLRLVLNAYVTRIGMILFNLKNVWTCQMVRFENGRTCLKNDLIATTYNKFIPWSKTLQNSEKQPTSSKRELTNVIHN